MPDPIVFVILAPFLLVFYMGMEICKDGHSWLEMLAPSDYCRTIRLEEKDG